MNNYYITIPIIVYQTYPKYIHRYGAHISIPYPQRGRILIATVF